MLTADTARNLTGSMKEGERVMGPSAVRHWAEGSASEIYALAERYGTPLYLYDADRVNDRIRRVRDALEHQAKVFYAVKANPNLELLRAIRDVADGIDVSSGGEVEQALLAGFDMATVSFAGPAKTRAELGAAIQKGVGNISVESMRELADCVEISKQCGTRANISIRVNPRLLNRSFGLKMGGRPIQFGIDEEDVGAALEMILAGAQHLRLRGIHIYAGSQCFDVTGVIEGVENTLRIVQEIEASARLTCTSINLGGGFGVAHNENGRELDLDSLASGLVPLLKAFRRSSAAEREIIFELGRFLVADAGVYVARVISSKHSRGKYFIIVDGGLHHHLAAAGTFGTALRSNYAVRNLSRTDASNVVCTIAGPSCNPTDMLGIDVELPRPEHGDLIAVLQSGSYGLTASPLLFLGRETPAEIVRHDGKMLLGRRRRSVVDFN